jgi:hypothetical protein
MACDAVSNMIDPLLLERVFFGAKGRTQRAEERQRAKGKGQRAETLRLCEPLRLCEKYWAVVAALQK